MYRKIGPSLRILQLNIEGASRSKSEQLSKILAQNKIDVAVVQETHVASESDIRRRGHIAGYSLIGATYHSTYGTATYIRCNLSNAALIEESSMNNIFIVTICVAGMYVVNIYKPPNSQWPTNVLPVYNQPSVYVGDFNSHHTMWKYATNDFNGEMLVDWTDCNNFQLVFDAKDRGTFHSRRWLRDYNPDLCFVSCDSVSRPLPTSRNVLADFPHSFNLNWNSNSNDKFDTHAKMEFWKS